MRQHAATLARADAMGRAYGRLPSEVLGLDVGPGLRLMLDAAAHEMGNRRLASVKGAFPNIDLGTL